MRRMAAAMMEGAALWEALRDAGFEADEVLTFRAAEATGQFERLIPPLLRRMEFKRAVCRGIGTALGRQVSTLVMATVAVGVLAGHFLPTVQAVVAEAGGTVPAWCRGILRFGQWFMPLWTGVFLVGWAVTRRAPAGVQRRVDVLVGQIPGLRRILREMDWGQAFLTAAAGEQAGIGSARAWAMAAHGCRTRRVRRACQVLAWYLEEAPTARDLQPVMREAGFPSMDVLAVQAAMQTGGADEVFRELGETHMGQAMASAQAFQDLLAEVILVAVGLMAAAIILGGYVPLFQAYGRFG